MKYPLEDIILFFYYLNIKYPNHYLLAQDMSRWIEGSLWEVELIQKRLNRKVPGLNITVFLSDKDEIFKKISNSVDLKSMHNYFYSLPTQDRPGSLSYYINKTGDPRSPYERWEGKGWQKRK